MATSKLQIAVGNLLDKTFPEYRIRENYRPEWLRSSSLTKLELDFFIEELKIGFEIQGAQHYQYVPFFHGSYDNYEKRKQYDTEKKDLCYGQGVRLIEIFTLTDAIVHIKTIEDEIGRVRVIPEQWVVCEGINRNYNKKKKAKIVTQEQPKQKKVSTHTRIEPEYVSYADIATPEQKLDEINQYRRKLYKYNKIGKQPSFFFKYLNTAEQEAILESFEIEEQIKSSIAKPDITDREMVASQEEDIMRWKRKSTKSFQKKGIAICQFESEYITEDISRYIMANLNNATTQTDIERIFDSISVTP